MTTAQPVRPSAAPDNGAASLDTARSMAHGQQLARIASKYPDRVALVCLEEHRTMAELDQRVSRLAASLAQRGVGRGDRLALLMGNSIEMVEAIFAGWRLGAIVVPVNFRLVADEVGFILADSGARLVIVDEHLAGLVGSNRPALPELEGVVVRGEAAATAGPGAELFSALMATDPTAADVSVAEHDPALIMYTSGTTGRPKGAVLTHFNLVMSTLGSMITQGIGGYDDVWYANLPLFHIGGLSGILPYIIAGGCSVIVPSGNFDAADAVHDLVHYGVTGCVFIGMQWDQVCDQVVASGAQLRLRRVSWGAANTPMHVLEKMSRVLPGVPIASFFGQTEMSPVTCVLSAADADRKRGSVGRPIVNVEARLVDDAGRDVAVGEVGEIVYRGPTVMQGYWNMPEANREAFAGGWFHSGDLCRMDDEGYYYVVDRKLDMIISGGENIYSPEVEAALRSHPGVADVSVIGVPHDVWGETPRAVVVPVDRDHPPAADELMAWCREHLASYKKPTSVVYVQHLPVNAAGKVLKPALRERYGTSALGDSP
jgi:acyl-CoA synthetase (AMP-forming)/AMP-acid ligase II